MSNSFHDLKVWKESFALSVLVYKVTQQFPKHEKWGLVSQLQRASVSVPANIAEGTGRNQYKDRLRFYHYARGSMNELETELMISKEMDYLTDESFQILIDQINLCGRLLNGLINSIKKDINKVQ